MQNGFFEQGLLIWWLRRTPGYMDRVYWEGDRGNAYFGLNRHFPQVRPQPDWPTYDMICVIV